MYNTLDFKDGYYDSNLIDVYFGRNVNDKKYIGIKNRLSLNNQYVSTIVDFYYLNSEAIECTISRINDLLNRYGQKKLEKNETSDENLYLILRSFMNKRALVKISTKDKYKAIKYLSIV